MQPADRSAQFYPIRLRNAIPHHQPRNWVTLHPVMLAKFATDALLNPEKFNGDEMDLAGENLTLDDVAKSLSTASGATIRTIYRTLKETAAVGSTKLPGFGYQIWHPIRESISGGGGSVPLVEKPVTD